MRNIILPIIEYSNFSKTRDTIQLYVQLISAIKGNLVPHQKNWEEYSLKIYAKGFTSTSIPIETNTGIEALDLNINLIEQKFETFFKEKRDEVSLETNTIIDFTQKLLNILDSYEIEIAKPEEKFFAKNELSYNKKEISVLWNLFRQVYFLMLKLRSSTLNETSNINFWPHHFDLALLVFSGQLIDGQDSNNWDYSREQMNFGLSSGDSGISEPYFYVTAYPFDDTLLRIKLPEFAVWHTEGWNGLVIKLGQLESNKDLFHSLFELFSEILNKNYG